MFKAVAVEDVPEAWSFLERGLARIQKRCKPPWSPRQIRGHLLQGRATAFVSDEGFVILEKSIELWTHEPYLNVWLMWFRAGEAKKRKYALVAWLDAMTKRERCYTWKFGSPRREWVHEMAEFCEVELITWRRKP